MRVVYTDLAVRDLRRLRAFIDEKNPAAARRVARELVEQIEKLSRFPRIGRPVERAPDPETVRDLVVDRYVVRYSLHETAIVILRIWHHFEERDTSP